MLAEQRLDARREADRLVRAGQRDRRFFLGAGLDGSRRACRAAVPGGRRSAGGPRAPLQVGDEGRTERRVGRQAGLVGRLDRQRHPAGALLIGELGPGRRGRRRAAEGRGDHGGLPLRAIRGHVREQRGEQVVGWHVLLVQQPGHPGQRGQAAGPFEQGRVRGEGGRGGGRGIAEVHVPVHAAAERLVLRVAAAAQGVVLAGRARGPGHVRAGRVGQRDRAGDAVTAVLGHLDGAFPGAVPVGQVALLLAVEGQAQRAGRAVPHGPDELVEAGAAGRDEGFGAGAERGRRAVGAQPGVLADAPVVEDRDLLPRVGVALVGHPVRVLAVGEPAGRVRPVAERLGRRGAAPAQRELRRHRDLPAERGTQHGDVGDQVGAVLGGHDGGRQLALELAKVSEALRLLRGGGLLDGQVLESGGGLEQAGRGAGGEARAQGGGSDGEIQE